MKTLKQVQKIMMILCITFTLCGCWDNRDINHRTLPIVMGISKINTEYKVFLQIPEPKEDTMKVKIVTQIGKTITEAVDKISADMESSVDLLHLKVIVLDKKYAAEGITDVIAGFMRARDVSAKTLVVISDDDLNTFFAKIKTDMESDGTMLMDFFEKEAGWNPQIALTRIWQVYRSIYSFTHDVAIPIIRSGQNTTVEHIGSAVIKNGKMVERITSNETLLLNAFYQESTQGKIEVMDHASVMIVSNSLSNQSKLINDTPYMDSQLELKVVLLETKGDPSMNMIKKELETMLTQRFHRLFAKIQSKEADILALGQEFRNKLDRAQLKNWRSQYYPRLKINLHVEVVIQNTGDLKNSP